MYYHDKRLQYPVKVETPDPLFARQLQQRSAASRARSASACNTSSRPGGPGARARSTATCCSTPPPRRSATSRCCRRRWPSTSRTRGRHAPRDLGPGEPDRRRGDGRGAPAARRRGHAPAPPALHRPWRPCRSIATARRSTARTSMPAATSSATCSATWRRRRPAHPGGAALQLDPQTRACRTCSATSSPAIRCTSSNGGDHRGHGGLKEGLPVPNSFDQSKEAQEFSYMFMGTERNGTPVPPGATRKVRRSTARASSTSRPSNARRGTVLGPARPIPAPRRSR